jgi:dynactin complex subunit
MTEDNKQIQLTPEQIISLVGHGVTQEQLDGVRRELSDKIEIVNTNLTSKIDNLNTKIDGVNKSVTEKIDSKFNMILLVLLANIAGLVTLAFWLGGKLPS